MSALITSNSNPADVRSSRRRGDDEARTRRIRRDDTLQGRMESLQQTAARVLGPLLDSQPLSPGKVSFAWSIAAGPALARASTPRWTPDGILRIRARSAA